VTFPSRQFNFKRRGFQQGPAPDQPRRIGVRFFRGVGKSEGKRAGQSKRLVISSMLTPCMRSGVARQAGSNSSRGGGLLHRKKGAAPDVCWWWPHPRHASRRVAWPTVARSTYLCSFLKAKPSPVRPGIPGGAFSGARRQSASIRAQRAVRFSCAHDRPAMLRGCFVSHGRRQRAFGTPLLSRQKAPPNVDWEDNPRFGPCRMGVVQSSCIFGRATNRATKYNTLDRPATACIYPPRDRERAHRIPGRPSKGNSWRSTIFFPFRLTTTGFPSKYNAEALVVRFRFTWRAPASC